MEKVTYVPLIEDFKNHSALYNQLYGEYRLQHGHFSASLLSKWIVAVVQPIVKATDQQELSEEKRHHLIELLYTQSLHLFSNGLAVSYELEYERAWLLLEKLPELLATTAEKTVMALNEAIFKVRKYTPEKVSLWIDKMENSVSEIKSLDDFMSVSRIFAWHGGLAHLRPKLQDFYDSLPKTLQEIILKTIAVKDGNQALFQQPWNVNQVQFQGIAGGFIGDRGSFLSPPKLTVINDTIIVQDSKNSYAFFADHYGKTLLPIGNVSLKTTQKTSHSKIDITKAIHKADCSIDPKAIASVVQIPGTIAFTLHHSYFLYTYSLPL